MFGPSKRPFRDFQIFVIFFQISYKQILVFVCSLHVSLVGAKKQKVCGFIRFMASCYRFFCLFVVSIASGCIGFPCCCSMFFISNSYRLYLSSRLTGRPFYLASKVKQQGISWLGDDLKKKKTFIYMMFFLFVFPFCVSIYWPLLWCFFSSLFQGFLGFSMLLWLIGDFGPYYASLLLSDCVLFF